MAIEKQFACPLPHGIHARPASALEEVARGFAADIIIVNHRTRRAADAKSILALVGADIRHLDACSLTCSGPDEQQAMAFLSNFLENQFPLCDQPTATVSPGPPEPTLPPCLAGAECSIYPGARAVGGIGLGRVVQAGGFRVPLALTEASVADPAEEWHNLLGVLGKVQASYENRLAQAGSGIEFNLLKVHRAITRDAEFRRQLQIAVRERHRSAAGAIADTEARFTRDLGASESPLLRDRALDIQDVCRELLRQRYGIELGVESVELTVDSIVVAESLTPGQFLGLNRMFLKGLALTEGGNASHTVILARSFNVPTLVGVRNLPTLHAAEAAVDADLGALIAPLTPPALRYYEMERRRLDERSARLREMSQKAGEGGLRIEANIAIPEEAAQAFAAGADGVGLFRTEMIFLGRLSPPDEQEQFECYRQALNAAAGKPVVIRTLDVGGDKLLPYLNLASESNPLLGYRAMRIYREFEAIFRTQLRALIRASAFGRLKIMIPLLATVEEARWVKKTVAQEQKACADAGLDFDQTMPVGAMIEVPAAALSLEHLSKELDFFSIGSNDLLQYIMGADRGSRRLQSLYQPTQPAFLRALHQIIDACHRGDGKISLCGEMGGEIRLLPLLAGSGLDAISASAPLIAGLRAEWAGLDLPECRQLWMEALDCRTEEEVAARVAQFSANRAAPLLDVELVLWNPDAATKEEAIKLAADRLFVMGRTDSPRAVEEAIWQRERQSSTGFGNGFAIPHCKTNAMRGNSVVVLKLAAPIPWDAIDGRPVQFVVLLAIRETDGAVNHLKILARLARLLTDDEFRARLEGEASAGSLCDFLRARLDG
ncbi:MAG TPA: phosphoenolpyruvate--protein phosphotransferase [Verrucomicrobiae bacterium]|jgi:fructose-specific PTS system IIA-like component|nr:phosphoenolpyruvate--protein phosphotransferase [Verrucomicrobiae bacterium]